MARKPTAEETFAALLLQYEGRIADAMLASFADLRNSADIQRVIAALKRGDVEDALSALHLDPAAFAPMHQAERDAFIAAGAAAIALLPILRSSAGHLVVVRFDPSDTAAVAWLNDHADQLVARIMTDQQAAVRNIVQTGLAAGRDPHSLALDIVGRINPATGVREGGVIGLTAQQEQFTAAARAELASGDPAKLRNYLARTLRDGRYDAAVQSAIADEAPLDPDVIERAVQSYQNRLLLQRGRTVGTTEAQQMIGEGQQQANDQLAASGALGDGDKIIGTWLTVGDDHVRLSHAMLDGAIQPHGQPFVTILGNAMRYPGDGGLGAGPEDIVNCRCSLIKTVVFGSNTASGNGG